MIGTRVITIFVALASVLGVNRAEAKGPTVQLTITGPGIEVPIHSDDDSVTSASVWGGNFVDSDSGPIENALAQRSDYQIYFWVQIPRGPIQMKYMIQYRWDSSSDRAIVCLPGERDPWYYVNVSSIIRGTEGGCFYAEEEWGNAIKAMLPRKKGSDLTNRLTGRYWSSKIVGNQSSLRR